MTDSPVLFIWMGDQFVPASKFWQKRADQNFVIGQRYALVEAQERSSASHRAYFASVRDAWQNLPDELTERFPSEDHLRKYALIKAGFCDTQTLVLPSHSAAMETARFIRPMDEFSIVTANGPTVTVYRARSQSYRAMAKDEFQRSKEEVLRIIAELIGTTPDQLASNKAA